MIKKYLLALAGAFAIASPSPVLATGSFEDHQFLYRTLQNNGVTMTVNNGIHCRDDNASGVYHTTSGVLAICQNNRQKAGEQVAWTKDDLDTLRHEAHHVVQDCIAGTIADGQLGLFFSDADQWRDFVTSALTEQEIEWIIMNYEKMGASKMIIAQELEAFAVAKTVNPRIIADKVNEVCR